MQILHSFFAFFGFVYSCFLIYCHACYFFFGPDEAGADFAPGAAGLDAAATGGRNTLLGPADAVGLGLTD